jgi:hypothetical protein
MTVSVHDLAEALHAEQHPGTFVPSLDGCPEHTRREWEAVVRNRYPQSVGEPGEYRLWNDQGTPNIYLRHDPCGTDLGPTRDLDTANQLRDQHECPREEVHA